MATWGIKGGGRPDEDQTGFFDGSGEGGVLGQKTVARMNRLGARGAGRRHRVGQRRAEAGLRRARRGPSAEELMPLLYDELRAIAEVSNDLAEVSE